MLSFVADGETWYLSCREELADRFQDLLSRWHAANPLRQGMPREEVRARLLPELSSRGFAALLEQALPGTDIEIRGQELALASHQVQLNEEQRRLRDKLMTLLRENPFSPPERQELDGLGDLEPVLKFLQSQGELVQAGGLVFAREAVDGAIAILRSHFAKEPQLTLAQFRTISDQPQAALPLWNTWTAPASPGAGAMCASPVPICGGDGMNLNLLRTFVTVVEAGNFSRAAGRLHLSQPAVSMQMQSLAQDLGAELFRRTGHRLETTEAGAILYQEAKELLRHWQTTVHKLDSLRQRLRGRLELGASTTPADYLLPPYLSQFYRLHPELELHMQVAASGEVLSALESGRLDLAVIGYRPQNQELQCSVLFEDELAAVFSPEHPRAGIRNFNVEDLLAQPLLQRTGVPPVVRSWSGLVEAGYDRAS